MEQLGKNKRPYHGIAIPFIVIIIVPIVFYILFYNVILFYTTMPELIVRYSALFFAGIVGFLFCVISMLAGFTDGYVRMFIERIRETKELFGLFTKDGIKYYFSLFWQDGAIIFWIFMTLLLANVFLSLLGFFNFYAWYIAQPNKDISAPIDTLLRSLDL